MSPLWAPSPALPSALALPLLPMLLLLLLLSSTPLLARADGPLVTPPREIRRLPKAASGKSEDEDLFWDFRLHPTIAPERKHTADIRSFGAVGDNSTLNTAAFEAAMKAAEAYGTDGGMSLIIPSGVWLTAPFNLTSHLTIHLNKGATILAAGEDRRDLWPVLPPLPSYGTGRGGTHIPFRYCPFVGGFNVTDIVIEGEDKHTSVIDGNGWGWWNKRQQGKQDITRGRLVEFLWSDGIVIQNLTLQNSPFWTTHFVYSANILARDLMILAPTHGAPNTDGFDPDSSENVNLLNTFISTGDDGVAIKSGWDCAGAMYGRPTRNVLIRNITAISNAGSISIGSEMSGGVENILVEDSFALGDGDGLHIKSSILRGGYVVNVTFNNIVIDGEKKIALRMNEDYTSPNPTCDSSWHPDPPVIDSITFRNIRILGHPSTPFKFLGLAEKNMTNIKLYNVSTVDKQGNFLCEYVTGTATGVVPTPCDSFLDSPSKRHH